MAVVPEATYPALDGFHAPVRDWFGRTFPGATRPQEMAWPVIRSGAHTLLLSPTGSGKTLAAFLAAIDRVMFAPVPPQSRRCRVLYISPLKALAVDVEKNLRDPLSGIGYAAERMGVEAHEPRVMIRTGDTPSRERAAFLRKPSDFLITTPESLFLMLTSQAREALRSVECVILDEIHAMLPTKRGAHLALSLERLAEIVHAPFQRIGLSATQRPLDEVARFLGGCEDVETRITNHETRDTDHGSRNTERPVQIVDAGRGKTLELRVLMPASELTPDEETEIPARGAGKGAPPSIWAGIHPLLLDQIGSHRSTLIFVNSRRLAERLATALNELAGEEIVYAHHGSLARERRLWIEEELKGGRIAALVATSSLELGIDMGAIDLVIQIESPPSVSSALQRIGRAGHQVGETSAGILVPKFRGDLLACAALVPRMLEGEVEPMHYPRSPLDVLAQQIVATVVSGDRYADDLEALIRRAAPFSDLPHSLYLSLLDMLSGRYPSDQFAGLRARITWDRSTGLLSARAGSRNLAIANAGTIPDHGNYGVYLTGAPEGKGRIGELDEEMVFESKVNDIIALGASSWRVDEITPDRVLVSPAPGRGGKLPFWHGDAAGRPAEFGRAIGALCRETLALPAEHAVDVLMDRHALDEPAARSLVEYLHEQQRRGAIPDDRTLVTEAYREEGGEWRLCLLSPYGAKVHAPLAMAAAAAVHDRTGREADILWTDDGIVARFPDAESPPDPTVFFPTPEEAETLLIRQLGVGGGGARSVHHGAPVSALFASRFREAAARALLLPRKGPGRRTARWQLRKRAADLLQVAGEFDSFPIVLEAFREIMQDDFDLPALTALLTRVQNREIRVVNLTTQTPTPFAASLLFFFVANFMYEGDAPLAERRAAALQIDPAQLRALLGTTELRTLLDPEAMAYWERHLQHLTPERLARHPDGLHDLLLDIGDLTTAEIAARTAGGEENADEGVMHPWLAFLIAHGRAFEATIAGEPRYIAIEDAARYRDALGIAPPDGTPESLLEPVRDAFGDLMSRYARTRGPFTATEAAARFGVGVAPVLSALRTLSARGRVVEGEFRPDGVEKEWCDAGSLGSIRRLSLEHLRREVEPVEPPALARLMLEWQGIGVERPPDIVQVIEQLQHIEMPASLLETCILPARVPDYAPEDLDSLLASGELVWIGERPRGSRDGYVRFYLAENVGLLASPPEPEEDSDSPLVRYLHSRGASFFPQIQAAVKGFPPELLEELWECVWEGKITNDSLQALRARIRPPDPARERRVASARGYLGRSSTQGRRATPPEAAGRWSLVSDLLLETPNAAERLTAHARLLLARYGIVTREIVQASGTPGGFSAIYPVLRAMEESGRIRRGYFVRGLGALQFALPAALERLRGLRDAPDDPQSVVLAAADPANPYGVGLPWPAAVGAKRPTRAAGAQVVLVDGEAAGWLSPDEAYLLTFRHAEEQEKRLCHALANALAAEVDGVRRRALLIESIDDARTAREPLHQALLEAGFVHRSDGYQHKGSTAVPINDPSAGA